MFNKILIANRGEIAVRIIRACRAMGIKTVAVYSTADRHALHTYLADEAVCIGPAPARDSYLNTTAILAAAQGTGADAIHPGYGFLSESSTFAKLCRDNDIVFIGPTPEVIDRMGNKSQARRTMMDAGVPVVPGTKKGIHDVDVALEQARTIGWPIMIKASSGGGGKGMRVSESEEDFADMFNIAQRESVNAFGDNTMYLERAVQNPRHVEVQIIADNHGNVVALGERDCSVQRNHQKMIEESPSPLLDADEGLRRRMMDDAVKAARAVDPELARAVAAAVHDANLDLVLVGLANSELIRAGQAEGIRTAQEFFADRNYTDEGLLVSRKLPDAVITDEDFAVARVVRAVKEGSIESASGKLITVKPDTICIHGDNVHALEFAGKIRTALTEAGVEVKPV